MVNMYYALAYFPNIDTSLIDQFRRKYDPTVDLVEPHITILFPVPDIVGVESIIEHIKHVLATWSPFQIHIHGFHKSWDHCLFLTLEEGQNNIIKLNREIYTGILAQYRRTDIKYIPHISLGLFVKNVAEYNLKDPKQLELDKVKYEVALKEARALGLDFKCTLDKLHFVSITNDFSHIEKGQEFLLA